RRARWKSSSASAECRPVPFGMGKTLPPGGSEGDRDLNPPRGKLAAVYTVGDVVTIAHISDPHVGSPFFVPNLMNRGIVELNELDPDAVICTGDLTNEGYRQEFKNCVAYFSRIRPDVHVIPGNHDSRNVGYLHFEE